MALIYKIFMRNLIIVSALVSLVSFQALAQTPLKPDVVLLPKALAEAATNWIASPDPTVAVKLYGSLIACLNNNPHNGVTVHNGQDQCPIVTSALAELTKAPEVPSPPPPTTKPAEVVKVPETSNTSH